MTENNSEGLFNLLCKMKVQSGVCSRVFPVLCHLLFKKKKKNSFKWNYNFFPDDKFTHTYLGVIVWISSHFYQGIILGYNLWHNRWVSIIEYDHSPRLHLPNRRAKIEAKNKLTVKSTIKQKLAHLCTCSYISRFPIKSKLMFFGVFLWGGGLMVNQGSTRAQVQKW